MSLAVVVRRGREESRERNRVAPLKLEGNILPAAVYVALSRA